MKEKSGYYLIFVLAIILLMIGFVSSQEYTMAISNSADWKDVYSTLHYSNLAGLDSNFLVSTAHGNIILNNIPLNQKLFVVSSDINPYVFNYDDLLISKGYQADELITNNANLELIERLNDVSNFIIVDDSYGFNAIAVIPYAVVTHSWVFFSNKLNIYEIDNILSRRNVDDVIIYGYVDREVRDVLEKYEPEVIDNGDKFEDNIEIVERYLAISPKNQVILTNGEFIEKEIMHGLEPNLFTGRENVPDKIRDYLRNSDIEVGVLIGNELVGAATNIRRSAGISVMVKFARGARSQQGSVAAVEGLDLFPLPTPYLNLGIYSVRYNRANSQIEITYKSNATVPIYLKGTITVTSELDNLRVGDLDPVFIAPGDYKTVLYPINLSSTENLKAEIYTLFGETVSSLDRILQASLDIEMIDVIDRCNLDEDNIKSVRYNRQKKSLFVKIKNNKDVDCWVDIEINNLIVGYSSQTISSENSVRIPKGKTRNIELKQELTKDDLDRNPFVDLVVYSGERDNSLVNTFRASYPLDVETLTLLAILSIIVAVIIIALIIIIIIIKRKEEEEY